MAECSFQNGCLLFSIGRRWCLFLYAVSCAFTLSCILVINLTKAMNTQVDMMLGITIFGKLGVTSTIVLILLVTLEVYPTSIRWERLINVYWEMYSKDQHLHMNTYGQDCADVISQNCLLLIFFIYLTYTFIRELHKYQTRCIIFQVERHIFLNLWGFF